MNKRFGLVLIEANAFTIWVIRFICLFLVILNGNTLIELFENGSFYRRGHFYSLAEHPTTFYIRVGKYAVFAFLSFWFMTIGTKVKNET